MVKGFCLALAILVLVACGAPDYPKDWPKPDLRSTSRKGSCPDLTGSYDRVQSELTWLLGWNPDIEKPIPVWQEHRATISQADDGSWLRIELGLNERGLVAYRERVLKYNMQSNGSMVERGILLRASRDYECSGGWLFSRRFAQAEPVRTMQRKSLQLARDRDGGLIAGATITHDVSFSLWAGTRGISMGRWDNTRWDRWPSRPASADAALATLQDVTVHRYSWINPGNRIPVRFTSFYFEPICVRYFDDTYPSPVHGPTIRRERDDSRPAEADCPDGWGRFDIGEVFRRDMQIPDETPKSYRIEWYLMNGDDANPKVIDINDVRTLPLMPESSKRPPSGVEEEPADPATRTTK